MTLNSVSHRLAAMRAKEENARRASTPAKVARPAPPPAAKAIEPADAAKLRNQAVASAVTGERERIARVFASPASIGRERLCARLLSDPKSYSAAVILAELPTLPTDVDMAHRQAADAQARRQAGWQKATAAANAIFANQSCLAGQEAQS